jgi:hypothetical protein
MEKRRAQRRKYHYIYKTTCKVTNRYYYGMHSTDNLEDGYKGSGKRLWYSINKHGKENHICEKVEFFETREKLREREVEIVNEELLKDPLCMNLVIGGNGGGEYVKILNQNSDFQKKQSIKGIAKMKQLFKDEEWVNKFKKSVREGMIKSEKVKGFVGKHSEESKRKIGSANSIKQRGERNSQYGTCWITNGKENKKIHRGDDIPNGYRLGRKRKDSQQDIMLP